VQTEEEWAQFCDLVGHREWLPDARFTDLSSRVANRSELDSLVESWTARHTPHQVMMILQRNGVAAGVVQTAEDLYRDPHLRERRSTREVFHHPVGWVTRAGPSVRLADAEFTGENQAHFAGEDNEAVFGELLGMSSQQIADLRQREVLR
jgi:crotonobetainyl-CoA:carnitine CoA-transferase CaiB-like acyl-CoA transferase